MFESQNFKMYLLKDMKNWSEEIFIVKKIKNKVAWTYVTSDLNGQEIARSFYEKELQKTNL